MILQQLRPVLTFILRNFLWDISYSFNQRALINGVLFKKDLRFSSFKIKFKFKIELKSWKFLENYIFCNHVQVSTGNSFFSNHALNNSKSIFV